MVHAVVWATEDTKYLNEVTIEKVNHLLTMVGGITFTNKVRIKIDNKIKKYGKYM
tara:strand:+ start:489 stop:653 length:165 start_codon:yes stop_codon:yes gene_type:complete